MRLRASLVVISGFVAVMVPSSGLSAGDAQNKWAGGIVDALKEAT